MLIVYGLMALAALAAVGVAKQARKALVQRDVPRRFEVSATSWRQRSSGAQARGGNRHALRPLASRYAGGRGETTGGEGCDFGVRCAAGLQGLGLTMLMLDSCWRCRVAQRRDQRSQRFRSRPGPESAPATPSPVPTLPALYWPDGSPWSPKSTLSAGTGSSNGPILPWPKGGQRVSKFIEKRKRMGDLSSQSDRPYRLRFVFFAICVEMTDDGTFNCPDRTGRSRRQLVQLGRVRLTLTGRVALCR